MIEHYKNLSLENIIEEINGVVNMEEWKDVLGYEGLYLASTFGRIKSIERRVIYSNNRIHIHPSKVLRISISRRGYHRVTLYKNGGKIKRMVHRIIGEAFIPNKYNKKTINHKKGIKSDNRPSQLEWATHSEQNIHAFKKLKRKNTSETIKKVAQYDINLKLIKIYPSYSEAERQTSVCKTSIIDCINNRAKTAGGFIWSPVNI